jgi:hypothetical protein
MYDIMFKFQVKLAIYTKSFQKQGNPNSISNSEAMNASHSLINSPFCLSKLALVHQKGLY